MLSFSIIFGTFFLLFSFRDLKGGVSLLMLLCELCIMVPVVWTAVSRTLRSSFLLPHTVFFAQGYHKRWLTRIFNLLSVTMELEWLRLVHFSCAVYRVYLFYLQK